MAKYDSYGKILKGRYYVNFFDITFSTARTADNFTNVGEYYSFTDVVSIQECDCTAFDTSLTIIGFREVLIAFIDYNWLKIVYLRKRTLELIFTIR